jgi:glycosyltransferase involved in cell wall biosynthesis
MHIAYDSQIFRLQENGGISKYFVKVIENLVLENDVCITVLSGIHKNEYLKHSNINYSGVFYFNFIRKLISNRFYDYTSAYNFFLEKNKLSAKKIDIIHQTYNGYELHKPINTKCIITIHDLIYEKYPNDFSDTQEVLIRKKASIENADHIICVSKNTQTDLINYYKVDISKTTVVYHGVEKFEKQNDRLFLFPYILYVGKRNGYKNFKNTLVAFENTKLKQDAKLICFGSSAFSQEETDLITYLGLTNDIVYFKGSDIELINLYQHAVFLIYPSIYEGFGLPVLEAMANDCPVICSDRSSLPEVSNNCALEINCEDITSVSRAMDKLFYDNDLRNKLIKLGSENVKKYTWKNTALNTLNVYQKVIKENKMF